MSALAVVRCVECDRALVGAPDAMADDALCFDCAPSVTVPYPEHCLHPEKCAGKSNCPRDIACVD